MRTAYISNLVYMVVAGTISIFGNNRKSFREFNYHFNYKFNKSSCQRIINCFFRAFTKNKIHRRYRCNIVTDFSEQCLVIENALSILMANQLKIIVIKKTKTNTLSMKYLINEIKH